MTCEMCAAKNEEFRLVAETHHSFSVVIIEPQKKGHLLIMPIRHVESFQELNQEEAKDLLDFVGQTRKRLQEVYPDDPILFMNFGEHSSQKHLHFHIIPSKSEVRKLYNLSEGSPVREKKSEDELRIMRDEIREHLQ